MSNDVEHSAAYRTVCQFASRACAPVRSSMKICGRDWPPTDVKLPTPTRREPSGETSILMTAVVPPFCCPVTGRSKYASRAPVFGFSVAMPACATPLTCVKFPPT
ncbi:hypothetical protein BJF79_42210 [Actinomadura sp. CNU-125]|nr:hypothetical protein BJF79_42210 [Actinomadura sp. CNU-125]